MIEPKATIAGCFCPACVAQEVVYTEHDLDDRGWVQDGSYTYCPSCAVWERNEFGDMICRLHGAIVVLAD